MHVSAGETAPTDWTLLSRCRAAVGFFSAVEATAYVAINRLAGADALDEVIARLLGDHMEAHFLDGLSKLSIPEDASDAVKCALYHVLSNELGGYRVGFVPESDDKAWIFYNVPYQEAHPWMGVAYAGLRPSYWVQQMLNWHAYDGEALGNRGVAFVSTHFVSLGDPYDAGYFVDLHRPLSQDERLQFRLGELPAVDTPISYPRNDAQTWPVDRRAKAHRNYARGYASAILLALIHVVGPERGQQIVEYILRTVLFSQQESLIKGTRVGRDDTRGTTEMIADAIAFIEGIAASESKAPAVEVDGERRATISLPAGSAFFAAEEWRWASTSSRQATTAALNGAFTVWASHLATDLSVALDPDGERWEVAASPAGQAAHERRAYPLRGMSQADLLRML